MAAVPSSNWSAAVAQTTDELLLHRKSTPAGTKRLPYYCGDNYFRQEMSY
jgi:hypothetical protein